MNTHDVYCPFTVTFADHVLAGSEPEPVILYPRSLSDIVRLKANKTKISYVQNYLLKSLIFNDPITGHFPLGGMAH